MSTDSKGQPSNRDQDQPVPSVYRDPAAAETVRALLADLFQRQALEPDGVNALRFRAQHEQQLAMLDHMAAVGWIRQRDRFYYVTLVSLADLAAENARADSLLYLCKHLFECLRQQYKLDPDKMTRGSQ